MKYHCKKLTGILAVLFLAATAAFGADQKINLNTASVEQLDSLPAVGRYTAEQIVALRPITDINVLLKIRGMKPEEVEVLRGLVTLGEGESTAPPATSAREATITPQVAPAPVTEGTGASGPKILYVTDTDLNQADRMLVSDLQSKGYNVKIASKAGFKLSSKVVRYTGKTADQTTEKDTSQPEPVPDVVVGKPNRLPPGTVVWDDSMVPEYECYIFAHVDGTSKLGLPIAKILASAKLVVVGEARSIHGGEAQLSGSDGDKGKSGQVKPYGVESSMRRVAYNIFYHTWRAGMELPTDQDTQEFISKTLVPKISSGLQ